MTDAMPGAPAGGQALTNYRLDQIQKQLEVVPDLQRQVDRLTDKVDGIDQRLTEGAANRSSWGKVLVPAVIGLFGGSSIVGLIVAILGQAAHL